MWVIINFYSVKLNETLKSVLRTMRTFTVFLKNSVFVPQAIFPYIFGCTNSNWVLSGMVGIKFICYYMGPTQVNNPKSSPSPPNLKYIIQHCHKLRMVLVLDILSNLIYCIYRNIQGTFVTNSSSEK